MIGAERALDDISSASPDPLITHHVTLPAVIRDACLHISKNSQDPLPGDNRQ